MVSCLVSPIKFFIILWSSSILHAAESFHSLNVRGHDFDARIRSPFQDNEGFIWFSSKGNVWRFDGFEMLGINDLTDTSNHDFSKTRFVFQDSNDAFWIGTENGHLFKIKANIKNVSSLISPDAVNSYYAATENSEGVWVATQNELIVINENDVRKFQFPTTYSNSIINALVSDGRFIYLATSTHLLKFNVIDQNFQTVNFTNNPSPPNLRSMSKSDHILWLSTDAGIYFKMPAFDKWQPYFPNVFNMRIRSVTTDDQFIWISTILDGLYRVNRTNDHIKHFTNENNKPNTLASNELTDLMIDHTGLVWVFHFNGSIDTLDLNQASMGLNQELTNSSCFNGQQIYSFSDDADYLWFVAENGIIKYKKVGADCQLIDTLGDSNMKAFDDRIPFTIDGKGGTHWIGSSDGILKLTKSDSLFLEFSTIKNINKIKLLSDDLLAVASDDGAFLINLRNKEINELSKSIKFKNIRFNDILAVNSHIYFSSSLGIHLVDSKSLSENLSFQEATTSMLMVNNDIWVGTQSTGIHILDSEFNPINHVSLSTAKKVTVLSLLDEQNGQIWVTTDNGLYQLDESGEMIKNYQVSHGLQGLNYTMGGAYRASDGKLFFAGSNGYNSFYSNSIKVNQTAPEVLLTNLTRFNQRIIPKDPSSELVIPTHINNLDELTLTHRDYVIGFEFSSTSFAHADENKYAYRMLGFHDEWNFVDADMRLATYTNLPSGSYKFQVKSSNHNDIWSDEIKTLAVRVLPPPWLTWWAISAYVVLILLLVYLYIQRKIKSNQLIADRLRVEVAEKTKELSIQKQTVESLLMKKNELFANVSHEFRTPLTLILGPINELIKKEVNHQDLNNLKMINRNANRLLSLVEQLLQIARVSNIEKIETTPQNTQQQISSLVESFQYMAQNKRIKLSLTDNQQATIDVTDQFIDAVLGNLLSNAIKYTQPGGSIYISATCTQISLILKVKDTGDGLSETQQRDIFKRFKRLDSHQAIEGIGIGLSVVEELVKVNNGEIQVDSEVGIGSEFTLRIPLADSIPADESNHSNTLVKQLINESTEVTDTFTNTAQTTNDNLNTVLVIEDNHDMRAHIFDIVSPYYNCITADNGVKGVAKAIEEVPDIIISDVMMPEMNGFKVARIIRSDQRTSHIPLMLLTALSDKTNRIKGWRENVDAYMTKPFDRDELLVQLENMLTIRDILKKKAGQLISQDNKSSSILPKKDQEFVDLLYEIIKTTYHNPILSRKIIANEMAVSERQLQRKVKALIDQNPMDVLREYRLNKSKELLKDGYQVSQVADQCGFNSVSYFSQCFKAHFGLSPKKYQQQD
jgi:signal transduction histidine kinase/DNA-binding response OmpR family regulator/ligand-binding sensor domain-containing protein